MLNIGARQTPPKVNRVPYIPMLKENNIRKGFFEHQDYLKLLKLLRIQRLREVKGLPYVFHREGEKIKDFRGAWEKACKEVDMEGKIFHDLRRTAVRNMVRAGIQEQMAMRISGHRTRAVFDRYNIVSPDDLKKATQKMADFHATVTNTVTIGNIEEVEQKSPTPQVFEINR